MAVHIHLEKKVKSHFCQEKITRVERLSLLVFAMGSTAMHILRLGAFLLQINSMGSPNAFFHFFGHLHLLS